MYRGANDVVRLGRGCMGKDGLVAGRLGGMDEIAVWMDEVAEEYGSGGSGSNVAFSVGIRLSMVVLRRVMSTVLNDDNG